ncbi:MAG TPA: hypothetical protein DCL35_04555 [Candidatus Omnitrophica bacterium]|nr:hypothetical protein [Candidatus Omnitrophota bacterium]
MAARFLKDDKEDIRSLHRRYLLWLYKTTKDELDKIERKLTQLDIDKRIEKALKKKASGLPRGVKETLGPGLKEWKEYIFQKESDAQKLKFNEDGSIVAGYLFLRLKLEAVADEVEARLGKKELARFKRLYEEACITRILEDTSGRR